MQSFPTPADVVRVEDMHGGFRKIFIAESGRPFHFFTQPDTGLPHDHPFGMTSHVVAGSYIEEVYTLLPGDAWRMETFHRKAGTSHRVESSTIHRIVALPEGYCLTHVEPGPPEQDWNFFRFEQGQPWELVEK